MAEWSCRRWAVCVLAGTLLLACGGCPIDQDQVVTETTRAALQAAVDSIVDALGQYLAGN